MNVSGASRLPAAAVPVAVRPPRPKDADGDHDGPAKTATAAAPKAAPVVTDGKVDVRA